MKPANRAEKAHTMQPNNVIDNYFGLHYKVFMAKRLDISGKIFGRLTVKAFHSRNYRHQALWLCECICGNKRIVTSTSLSGGHTTSCGCRRTDSCRKALTTHGATKTSEYKSWRAMRDRCKNPRHSSYKNYGGRGISIDKKWEDFTIFLKDMGFKPSSEYSIDRIDNNGNYEPSNCRWSTSKDQNRNKRIVSNVCCPNCSHIFDVMSK
jgi:hypothetical protein